MAADFPEREIGPFSVEAIVSFEVSAAVANPPIIGVDPHLVVLTLRYGNGECGQKTSRLSLHPTDALAMINKLSSVLVMIDHVRRNVK